MTITRLRLTKRTMVGISTSHCCVCKALLAFDAHPSSRADPQPPIFYAGCDADAATTLNSILSLQGAESGKSVSCTFPTAMLQINGGKCDTTDNTLEGLNFAINGCDIAPPIHVWSLGPLQNTTKQLLLEMAAHPHLRTPTHTLTHPYPQQYLPTLTPTHICTYPHPRLPTLTPTHISTYPQVQRVRQRLLRVNYADHDRNHDRHNYTYVFDDHVKLTVINHYHHYHQYN